ncbi:MAG: YraN family protein [Bacteroides sp.]|nr:YraN family protein [Bacteroides sp.]
MAKESKLRDLEFGRFAEDKAAEYYIKNGYAIRERNWRYHHIEIDLIVQADNVIVFVEVKARSGRDVHPLEAVTLTKMKRMTRGADYYLRCMVHGNFEYRYDIVTLIGDFSDYIIEIYEDAFVSPLLSSH